MAVSAVEVSFDLPFFLRLESPFAVEYEKVCHEARVPELVGQKVELSFSRRLTGTQDRSGWPGVRSTILIRVETPTRLSDESVECFAIQNCLEILNRLIDAYQAATGEVHNGGFVVPLGTSDMQLFAEIRVDGRDIRDRWPCHGGNTFPLSQSELRELTCYFLGQESLPLPKLLLVNATLQLERGQYSLAVLLSAAAVELRITQVVRERLQAAGWSDAAIRPYERLTLGQKLRIHETDPRSLETYFHAVDGFSEALRQAVDVLLPLRNRVAHEGHLASHEEGKRAVAIARDFLRLVR